MRALLVVIVTVCAAVAAHSEGERIVGGSPAREGQFPYQVSLRQNGRHFCGGSILNDLWVVTAAHCVQQLSGRVTVVTGTTSLSNGGEEYDMATALFHRGFDPQRLVNDIAMIKVAQPMRMSGRVQPISVYGGGVSSGTPLMLSGWGLTSYPGNIPDHLQFAQLRALDIGSCSQALQTQIGSSQICTFTRFGQGACQGDSGGPLVSGDQLAGIVSWGQPCAQGVPDVFTRAGAFLGWIDNVMQTN